MKYLLTIVHFSLFFLSSGILHAQLTVVQGSNMGLTPEQLVQNYLVGPGVTVSNVTFNGSSTLISSNQVGTFETAGTASSQLGLSGGILMTSGTADLAIGPNNKTNAGFNSGGGGDPDLNAISNSNTFDKAILEFDFVPEFDTVRFRYVFGSEEFFEYCSGYNDAFGFFLSGPGINGTFSNNAINIALMPGGSASYVTINNICNDLLSRWDNNGGLYCQYDALTYVFTAMAAVQPCSTYHIKLAIADAVDHIYDSGVFLEENSFTSLGVTLTPSTPNPAVGMKAVEGCNDIILSFKLTSPPEQPFTVNYTITGSATNGTDYTTLPASITFPVNTDSLALVIHPLLDLIPEGPETVIITVDQISCNGTVTADTVTIHDYLPMILVPQSDSVLCHGEDITLRALPSGGLYPYAYLWSPGGATDSILHLIPPAGDLTYTARVTDLCNNAQTDTIRLLVHPSPFANAGADTTIPNGTGITLHGQAGGGYGNYTWEWTSVPAGFQSTLQHPATGNLFLSTIFSLRVTDASSLCKSEPDEMIVAVEGGPLSANPAAIPPAVCLGSPAEIFALAGGGSGWYTFSWSSDPPGFNSGLQNPIVEPEVTTTYHVIVNDGFNTSAGSVTVTVLPLPSILLGPPDTMVCIYDTLTLDAGNPGSTYDWSNGSTTRTITATSSGIGFEMQEYLVRVTNANGCTDSAAIQVFFSFSACTGISEISNPFRFILYPNPSDGVFTLHSGSVNEPFVLSMTSLTGVQSFRQRIIPGNSGLTRVIDPGDIPPGVYMVNLQGATFNTILKVIIR